MTKRSSVPTVSICAVGLLVLVALVGFGTLPEYIRELGIARQLAKSGLRVSFRRGAAYRVNLTFDPGVRNGILRMTDSEDSAPRQFSELEDTRITLLPASTIDQLVELRRLEILMLGWSNLSDRDIKSISQLRTIQQLHVYCTYITDDGIRYLRDLPMLEDINLAGTSVGDRGVDYLPEEQLKKINLVNTQVSGAVLAKLANCHKLEFLWLPRIELTHADLQNLASMKNLKDLRIQCPGLGDEEMAYLGGLKRIRKLHLSGKRPF